MAWAVRFLIFHMASPNTTSHVPRDYMESVVYSSDHTVDPFENYVSKSG